MRRTLAVFCCSMLAQLDQLDDLDDLDDLGLLDQLDHLVRSRPCRIALVYTLSDPLRRYTFSRRIASVYT